MGEIRIETRATEPAPEGRPSLCSASLTHWCSATSWYQRPSDRFGEDICVGTGWHNAPMRIDRVVVCSSLLAHEVVDLEVFPAGGGLGRSVLDGLHFERTEEKLVAYRYDRKEDRVLEAPHFYTHASVDLRLRACEEVRIVVRIPGLPRSGRVHEDKGDVGCMSLLGRSLPAEPFPPRDDRHAAEIRSCGGGWPRRRG